MKKNTLPLIGITLDSSISNDAGSYTGYSQYFWYALREKYPTAVSKSGGIPLMLSYEEDLIEDTLSHLQGLLITGGRVDINPIFYGETDRHPSLTLNERRTRFELLLLKKALSKNIPVLGICGGHQLINVAFGGTLIQDIPSENRDSPLSHSSETTPLHTYAHSVTITPGTRLFQILEGASALEVNSGHHQGIKCLGDNLKASATSPDAFVEALESSQHSFVMGLQWHPEFLLDAFSSKIFTAFVKAANDYKGSLS